MKNYSLNIQNLKRFCFSLYFILLLTHTNITLASIVTSKTNVTTLCSALIKPVLNKVKAKKNRMITTTTVSTIASLQTAINNSTTGDVIVLADGTYLNGSLAISKSNITVRAATPGGVYWNSDVPSTPLPSSTSLAKRINISGSHVTFSGFQFTSGDIGGAFIIEVSGSHNVLSHLNFSGYYAQKYIRITGGSQYNEISYCNIQKKPAAAVSGCTIQITTSETVPGYHKIRYCSFQDFEGIGGDFGNEPIRIGLSTENNNASRSVVEYCYFNNTGLGDSESVSIKSKENTIRFCTFTNQQNAMLVFRNGDNNVAYSNFFINAGGIRVKEANNIYCYNNYFYNSGTSSGSNAADAITLLYVIPVGLRTSNLVNINFIHNTFVNCGKIDLGGTGATNNTWANNIFKKTSGSILINANTGTSFAGNIYQGTLGLTITSGMYNTNPNLVTNPDGYYGIASGSPAIDAASLSYPPILHITDIDDDSNLLYDVSGQSRPNLATSKDIGCDEFTTGSTTNHPLVLSEVGPSYLEINYKTITSGNFNDVTIWKKYTSNGILTTPTTAPTGVNNMIISSGNEVTLTNDVNFNSKKTFTVNGKLTTGGKNLLLTAGATAIFGPSSELIINGGTTNFNACPVTLQSNSTGTARIGTITGSLLGATNVTIERYIPAKRAWRALTAPLKGSDTSIFSQWQNGGTVSTGTGVELWGPEGVATPTTLNSGLAFGPFNSILQYDNLTTGAWAPVTNTNSIKLFTTNGNNAFFVFPTGGYGSGIISSIGIPEATTLKATGQLITGDVPYVIPSNSHTLIGNPYASPISPLALLTANTSFDNNLWIWDPNVAGDLNVGAYNLFTKTGVSTGTYTNTSGSSYTSNPTPDIQSGQAFFVKAISGTPTLTISESFKTGVVSSNAIFRDAAPAELLRLSLYKQESSSWSGRDGAIALFFAEAQANQIPNKMINGSENVAFTKNGTLFASEHHLPLVASDVLNVRVWNTTAGANYKLKINTEQFTTTNLDATLEDLYTNSRTPLTLNGTAVEYPFAVTTEATSTGNRFRIVFETNALGINNPKASGISIVPNPISGDIFQVNLGTLGIGTYAYTISNALGQEVEKGSINNVAQNTSYSVKFKNNTAAGIYIMKVTGTDNTVFTAKIIKK